MFDKLKQWRLAIHLAVSRMSVREQLSVVVGGLLTLLLVWGLVNFGISRAMTLKERRVAGRIRQLEQVLALRGEYHQRQEERAARLRTLGRSNVRLISLVEDAARRSGIDIGQLRPEDGEAGSDGVIESRVDLRASGLSADRLQEFLNVLESSGGIVVVRHLKISRPYRKDVADIELTVSTFKLKAA